MNEQLKALYDCFYEPLPAVRLKQEIEDCHQALITALEKPERRLVLQIIDAKDQIAEDRSIDSFIAGFSLPALTGLISENASVSHFSVILYHIKTDMPSPEAGGIPEAAVFFIFWRTDAFDILFSIL